MRRWKWLTSMVLRKHWTRGAELGVKEGQTLFYLLDHCPLLSMIGIDIWSPQPEFDEFGYLDWPHEQHEKMVRKRAIQYADRVIIIKALTKDAIKNIQDKSLDFVFVDANHSTRAVIEDCKNWTSKIKPGGMLCGHDANKSSVQAALYRMFGSDWKYLPKCDHCWYKFL